MSPSCSDEGGGVSSTALPLTGSGETGQFTLKALLAVVLLPPLVASARRP